MVSVSDTDTWDPTSYDQTDPSPNDNADNPFQGFDTGVDETTGTPHGKVERVGVIRTSDRIMFRRCRRRWGWQSHLRGNLGSREAASPLWMGSGFHFALEDFHGDRRFDKAADAFTAYVEATKRHDRSSLPVDWAELHELSRGMLDYYQHDWLRYREPLQTFVWNGVRQVEVNFRVDIPFDARHWGFDRVVYSGTIDRVAIDEFGQLWIVEYKTAKSIQTLHLANDSQVSAYCWAAAHLYDRPIAGVIYQQHRKDTPNPPKRLANGRISVDKRQLTTASAVRGLIKEQYGSVQKAPGDIVEFLNVLTRDESPKGDKFILRNYIQRNEAQAQAEGEKILMEAAEMLNPELPLYPNPDRTCQFMCPFNSACVSIDDGSDWEYEIELWAKPRERFYDSWRKKVIWPDQIAAATFE